MNWQEPGCPAQTWLYLYFQSGLYVDCVAYFIYKAIRLCLGNAPADFFSLYLILFIYLFMDTCRFLAFKPAQQQQQQQLSIKVDAYICKEKEKKIYTCSAIKSLWRTRNIGL